MELDDLTSNLRDFFLGQYKETVQGTSSFIAFEPLGHMIIPGDFKVDGAFDEAKSTDQLSAITDFVPGINSIVLPGVSNTVSGGYGVLLASAQFCEDNITGSIDPYLSLFGKIKSDAQRLYQSQPSTIGGPASTTYVCNGNPSGWYDPGSPIWQHKTISTGSSAQTPAPPRNPIIWKLNPIAARLEQNKQVFHLLSHTAPVQAQQPKVNPIHPILLRPALSQQTVAQAVAHPPATIINKNSFATIYTALPLDKRILVNRAMGDTNNANTSSASSSAFTMEFSYSLVHLDRPWMNQQLIAEANIWYSLSQKKGFYSTGANDSSNTGILCAVPKAMIVIKDLNISAQWSAKDQNAAASAYGFGSFNITTSSFKNNTLTAPGIQIIGWVCEVLPELPLNDDKNISL